MLSIIILLVMAVQDARHYIVDDKFQIALLVSILFEYQPSTPRLIIALLLMTLFTKTNKYLEKYIGGGDLKLISILFIGAGMQIIVILFIATMLGLIYGLIRQSKKIPFVPFLWLGVMFVAF